MSVYVCMVMINLVLFPLFALMSFQTADFYFEISARHRLWHGHKCVYLAVFL